MVACLFCGRGPTDGVDLYRLNEKGERGQWTCGKHLARTDVKPHPEILAIKRVLQEPERRPHE